MLRTRTVLAERDGGETGVRFDWTAPVGCPDAGEVAARIRGLLGEPGGVRPMQDLVFRGTVTARDSRWELRAEAGVTSSPEVKTIEAASCALLADAFALIVAFGMPTEATRASHEDGGIAEAGALDAAPPPQTPSGKEPPSEVTSGRRLGLEFAAGPVAAAGVGHLPSLATGVGGTLAVETGRAGRWELGGMVWLPQEKVFGADSARLGVQVRLVSFGPSFCAVLGRAAQAGISACARIDLGAMSGEGVAPSRVTGRSWWLTFGAGLAAAFDVTEMLAVRGRIDLGVPVFRPEFMLEVDSNDSGFSFRPAAVFGVLTLEPELRFFSTARGGSGHSI